MIKHILFLVISYVAVLVFMLYSETFNFGIALFLGLATALFCLAIILKERKELEGERSD